MKATFAALKNYGVKPKIAKPVIRPAKDVVRDALRDGGFDIIDVFHLHDPRDPLDLMAVTFRIVKKFGAKFPRDVLANLAWCAEPNSSSIRVTDYKQADTVLRKRFVEDTLTRRVQAPQFNFVDEAKRYLAEKNKAKK